MRICNFNASPSPGKLPKHSHPQTSVPIRSLALPPPVPSCLLILSLFFFFSVSASSLTWPFYLSIASYGTL